VAALVGVLIVIVVLVAAALFLRRRDGQVTQRSLADAIPSSREIMPSVDFKVEGSTAHVYFDTQIPAGGADDVLEALMNREARRVFDDKAGHLPVDQVKRVIAHGMRGGEPVQVGEADLTTPAAMEAMDAPGKDDVKMASEVAADHDPLAHLHDMDFGRGGGSRPAGDDLPPLAEELKIPQKLKDSLAGAGIVIDSMSLEQFIVGLLKTSGYSVGDRGDGTARANRAGTTTLLQFVEHEPSSHPELSESAVDGFAMRFASSGADRGMLFSAKYCPYAIYDRERREPRVRFITRERLQHFVNSVAMG